MWNIKYTNLKQEIDMFSEWGVLIPRELKNKISNHIFPFKNHFLIYISSNFIFSIKNEHS